MPLNKKWLAPLGVLVVVVLAVLAFSDPGDAGADNNSDPPLTTDSLSGTFIIRGNSLVAPLSRVWAAEYMSHHLGVTITVIEDNTSGLSVLDGTAAIYQAMPQPTPAEVEQAKTDGIEPYEIRIASDALSIIRYPTNPVELLTIAQVSAIYSGQIVNWKELGGNYAPIRVYAMPPRSEAYNFFVYKVLHMAGLPTEDHSIQFGANVIFLSTADEGLDLVTDDPNAIFFIPVATVTQEVTPTWIVRNIGDEPTKACLETTTAGIFPIYRPLFFYTDGTPTGVIKDFIDYCLSEEGQGKVMAGGYLRLFYP